MAAAPIGIAGDVRRLQRYVFIAILAAVVLLVLGGGFAAFSALRSEHSARQQIARTQAVVASLLAALQAGLNAETGERGFLLTGREDYLAPYEIGREAIDEALGRLDTELSVRFTPSQTAGLKELREHYEALFGTFARAIAHYRADRPNDVRSIVASGDAKQTMDRIRALTDQLIEDEQGVLARALAKSELAERRTFVALSGLGMGVVALLAFTGWIASRAIRLEAAGRQKAIADAARDMAELKSRELNHRMKNVFSLVLAILSLTSRDAATAQEAIERARERIGALARAHEASLGRNETGETDLERLTSLVLAPYAGSKSGKIVMNGPALKLSADTITPLGLILHEWATNAAKYGALCVPSGSVALSWRVETEDDGKMLVLDWIETGGPLVTGPPDRSGFGARMTEMASTRQLGGRLDVEWPEQGMRARLHIPLHGPDGVKS